MHSQLGPYNHSFIAMILIGQANLGSGKFGITKRLLISLVVFKFMVYTPSVCLIDVYS